MSQLSVDLAKAFIDLHGEVAPEPELTPVAPEESEPTPESLKGFSPMPNETQAELETPVNANESVADTTPEVAPAVEAAVEPTPEVVETKAADPVVSQDVMLDLLRSIAAKLDSLAKPIILPLSEIVVGEAKSIAPEVTKAVDAAESRLAELEAKIASAEDRIAKTAVNPLADAPEVKDVESLLEKGYTDFVTASSHSILNS